MNADQLIRRYEGRPIRPSGVESNAVTEWLAARTFEEFRVTPFPLWMTQADMLDCVLYLRGVLEGRMAPLLNRRTA